SSLRPAITTAAPPSQNRFAVASPMPRDPPVTSTTRPSQSIGASLPVRSFGLVNGTVPASIGEGREPSEHQWHAWRPLRPRWLPRSPNPGDKSEFAVLTVITPHGYRSLTVDS